MHKALLHVHLKAPTSSSGSQDSNAQLLQQQKFKQQVKQFQIQQQAVKQHQLRQQAQSQQVSTVLFCLSRVNCVYIFMICWFFLFNLSSSVYHIPNHYYFY